MRRFVRDAARYPGLCLRASGRAWDAFWFTPSDPTLLGVLRVLTGLMLLYTHAVWGLVLDEFFGPTAWLNAELVRTLQAYSSCYSFWWLVPAGWEGAAHLGSMVVLALFTVGFCTRITSILALAVAISYAHRTPESLFGLDQINVMLTLYLAIGDAGRSSSVDRWLARRVWKVEGPPRPSVRANLGRRLIQVHMCVIYFFAGVSKLQGPSWWDGTAMWRAFANLEYQTLDMTWLAWHPWALNLLTHATVVWEISFAALIWQRLWRPLVLACGVAMHVGIGLCLGMWTFGLIMLVGCASFLPASLWRRRVVSRSAAPARVEEATASEPELLALPNAPQVPAGPHAKVRLAMRRGTNGSTIRVDYGSRR